MALTKATLIDLNSNELILDLDADTSITADTDDTIHFKIAGSDEITMTATAFAPSTSDGQALGTSSLMFADLFLASGSVVNFNNGDVTLTHSSNTLTLGGGALDVDGGITIDNITIDGTEIDLSSGDLTIDVAGDIILDADGGDILIKDAGTTIGEINMASSNLSFTNSVQDKDILFKGNDGGSTITALTLDMSAAGAATFNDKITAVGTSVFTNLDISGDVDIDGTTNLDVVDIDGAVDMATTLAVAGVVTANAGVVIDNITIDGTTIALSSGSLGINVAAGITLDAGSGNIEFSDDGTGFANFTNTSGNLIIKSGTTTAATFSGANVTFAGTVGSGAIDTGSSNITSGGLLKLDVDADADDLTGDSATGRLTIGAGEDLNLYHGGTNSYIVNDTGDLIIDTAGDIILDAAGTDFIFKDGGTQTAHFVGSGNNFLIVTDVSDGDFKILGNDGGSQITALTLDMSAAGAAEFNAAVTANAGVKVDNITIDGTEIDLSSGDLTIDVAGRIALSADDNGEIRLQDGASIYGQFKDDDDRLRIESLIQDKDILFVGNDGGSEVTAASFDMSDAGKMTVNNGINVSNGDISFADGHGIDFSATADSSATGATDSSEILKDYEEGDWTPASNNLGMATVHTAKYIKIGEFVSVYCDITRNASPSDTSQGSAFSGMPFNAGDDYPNGFSFCANVTEAVRTGASGGSMTLSGLDGTPLTRSQLAGNRCQHYVTFNTL